MSEKSFFHRFVIPLCAVIIPLLISFVVYFNAARIENDTLHQYVAVVSGLVMVISVMFGALIIYPLAFFRGAKPAERIVACLVSGILFELYEIYMVSRIFPLAESLYFALNPTPLMIFLLAFGFMGICELACRRVARQRGDNQVKILTPAPVAAVAVMLIGLYVMLIWGSGAHFFYIYVSGYLALFR